eukprot:6321-Heterococcus_DN1.PRE.1
MCTMLTCLRNCMLACRAYKRIAVAAAADHITLGKPDTRLACRLLELVAREKAPAVRDVLYSAKALSGLREFLEAAPDGDRLWAVYLVSAMLREVRSAALLVALIVDLQIKKPLATSDVTVVSQSSSNTH